MKMKKQNKNSEINNLYNCTEHKTRRVNEYINSLEEPKLIPNETIGHYIERLQKFKDKIKEALNSKSSNEALEIIGYEYKKKPKIYNK
jgi:hypothetical protein